MPDKCNARPLIINTRPRSQARNLSSLLEAIGVEVCELPMIEIRFPEAWEPIVSAALPNRPTDWFFITSVNGAIALDRMFQANGGLPARESISVGAVGAVTEQKLRDFGFVPLLCASDENAETLAQEFLRMSEHQGCRCVLVKGNRAGTILPDMLRGAGHEVVELVSYFTESAPPPSDLELKFLEKNLTRISGSCFFSPSAVRNFEKFLNSLKNNHDLRDRLYSSTAFCIGAQTESAARDVGFKHRKVGLSHSDEALVESVLQTVFSL